MFRTPSNSVLPAAATLLRSGRRTWLRPSGRIDSLKLTSAEYNTADWFGNDSFVKEYEKAWGVK